MPRRRFQKASDNSAWGAADFSSSPAISSLLRCCNFSIKPTQSALLARALGNISAAAAVRQAFVFLEQGLDGLVVCIEQITCVLWLSGRNGCPGRRGLGAGQWRIFDGGCDCHGGSGSSWWVFHGPTHAGQVEIPMTALAASIGKRANKRRSGQRQRTRRCPAGQRLVASTALTPGLR